MSAARILVVEDEMIIARELAMHLQELGYEPVGSARTGEKAIEMAGLLRPDLVLMDVHLAGAMDGIMASTEIRTQFRVPSVLLSAFAGPDSLALAEQAGPAACLMKPYESHALRAVIEAGLLLRLAD